MKTRYGWLFFAVLLTLLSMKPAAAENLVIKGSTTVLPIAEKISRAYMEDNPDVTVEVSGGGSGNGIKAIIDKTTDIGNASRFIKEKELDYARGKGIYPVPFRIAYDCIIAVVHRSNPVGDISLGLLRQIYTGKIKNWQELGGKDRNITVVSRDTSSGTYEVWEKQVMQNAPVLPGAMLKASNAEVAAEVARNPGAIGYIGLGYLNSRLKPLPVDSIAGNVASTLDGSYPISRPLFMFTNGWPKGETLKFINYVLEPGLGQKLINQEGFVSLYKTELPAAFAGIPDKNLIPETAANVRMIQEFLHALDYPVGPVDGIKGRRTNAAIVQFEKDHGLPIDLRLTRELIQALTDQYVHNASQ
jgi:phosphate transport system substrate-binding protein